MKKQIKNNILSFFVSCVIMGTNSVSYAQNTINTTQNTTTQIQNDASFEEWKAEFRTHALSEGVDESFLDKMLPKMALLPHVIESDKKQPEFRLTFWDYTDKVFSQKRLKDGRQMMKKYADLLNKAEQKYNVPAKYITAFWGLETAYGTYKGNVDTLNALTTLAYDKRRRTFFTKELVAFLKIMHQEKLTDVKGSWAGAFGHFQFMPTTFAAYAVDGDGDGKRDIVNSLPDAVESAANYLSKIGWNDAVKWGREVKITQALNWDDIYDNPIKPIREWKKQGVHPANGMQWPSSFEFVQARLVLPMGIEGPIFLAYHNYDVVMKWNRSNLYALAVGLLSDALIMGNYHIYTPRKNMPFSYEQAKEIQELLTQKGYYTGTADGILGRGSRKAIRAYQKDNNLPQDGYATEKLLNKIRGI